MKKLLLVPFLVSLAFGQMSAINITNPNVYNQQMNRLFGNWAALVGDTSSAVSGGVYRVSAASSPNDLDVLINTDLSGLTDVTVLIDVDCTLSTAATIEASWKLENLPGAVISGTGSPTLTINGSLDVIGKFYDPATVTLAGTPLVDKYDVTWAGAVPGSGDDTAAIQAMIDLARQTTGGGQVFVPQGEYHITNLDMTAADTGAKVVWLRGAGKRITTLIYTGTGVAIDLTFTSQCKISDFRLTTNNSSAQAGILLARNSTGGSCNGNTIRDMYFGQNSQSFRIAQIYGVGMENTQIFNNFFEQGGVVDANNPRRAIYLSSYNTYSLTSETLGTIGSNVSSIYNSIIDNQFFMNMSSSAHFPVAISIEDFASSVNVLGNDFGGLLFAAIQIHAVNTLQLDNYYIKYNKIEALDPGSGSSYGVYIENTLGGVAGCRNLKLTDNIFTGTSILSHKASGALFNNLCYKDNTTLNQTLSIEQVFYSEIQVRDPTVTLVGSFWTGTEIVCHKNKLTLPSNHGCSVKFIDEFEGGEGIHRKVFNYDDGGSASGQTAFLPHIYPMTADMNSVQKDVAGIIGVADNNNWDPLNVDGAKPYPVFFSDPNWVSLGVNEFAANTNTPSGATIKAMLVYDSDGTLVGYVPVYGSAW